MYPRVFIEFKLHSFHYQHAKHKGQYRHEIKKDLQPASLFDIDYLLLERPILFLPYDREAYLKTRGFNFDYDEVTPGPKPKSYAEFLNSIEGLLYNEMNYVENRKKIERKFNKIQKPCSEDICRMVKMMCIR